MEKLCSYFGHPETAFPTIHVAGTNGKGSVCTKIAAALQNQGYRTGLYTSPHISSFCERIRIDSIPVAEEEICKLYPKVLQAIETCELTPIFFEIATLLAFLLFREQNVEIAVIETGLGGLYDATNVVRPLVSVITSIGLDHQEILGSSLQEICQAKAGILKPDTPAILGKTVPTEWILPLAQEKRCPLLQTTLSHPNYDEENRATARLALQSISDQLLLEPAAITAGLQAMPPCRFERRRFAEKDLIFDVAHNLQGFERLIALLHYHFPSAALRFVCGFSKGKEIDAIAKLIEPAASAIHLVTGPHPRLAPLDELAPYFPPQKTLLENSIAKGVQNACEAAAASEVIVVAGSFFIMEEALI